MTNKKEPEEKITDRSLEDHQAEGITLTTSPMKIAEYKELQRIKFEETKRLVYFGATILLLLLIMVMTSINNQEIYEIDKETLLFINKGYNAAILLIIPFLLGAIGATTRLLLSGIKVGQESTLALGSGLMAAFSWIGIKSGVLLSIVAPHIKQQGIDPKEVISSSSDFYTMALVAVFVGMFSTNLYLFISQRVEQLSSKKKAPQN